MQENLRLEKVQEYLSKNVYWIVEAMVNDLLLNQPEDVVEFMLVWLREKGNQVLMSEWNEDNKTDNLSDDSDYETDEQDKDELQEQSMHKIRSNNKRESRMSVSAEVYGTLNPYKEIEPEIHPKSDDEKQELNNLLREVFLFRYLSEQDMVKIIQAMKKENFKASEMIINEGDEGDKLYLVQQGVLSCFKTDSKGNEQFLIEYKKGGMFGELALLYCSPRAASIRSKTDVVLFSLSREMFNAIVKQRSMRQRQQYEEFLSKVEILSNLEPYERSKLCDCLKTEFLDANSVVIKEGEKGDRFYIIIKGELTAYKFNEKMKRDVEVMNYWENMYFGELALINNVPRKATIITKTDCQLASIDKKSFSALLGSLEEIMRRHSQIYVTFND